MGGGPRAHAGPDPGRLPQCLVACVGGGSNAMGLFYAFYQDPVRFVGVEAAGHGLNTGHHSATLVAGSRGVLHGAFSYLLQDPWGNIQEAHSLAPGLDYPGGGPEHSFFKDEGRGGGWPRPGGVPVSRGDKDYWERGPGADGPSPHKHICNISEANCDAH